MNSNNPTLGNQTAKCLLIGNFFHDYVHVLKKEKYVHQVRYGGINNLYDVLLDKANVVISKNLAPDRCDFFLSEDFSYKYLSLKSKLTNEHINDICVDRKDNPKHIHIAYLDMLPLVDVDFIHNIFPEASISVDFALHQNYRDINLDKIEKDLQNVDLVFLNTSNHPIFDLYKSIKNKKSFLILHEANKIEYEYETKIGIEYGYPFEGLTGTIWKSRSFNTFKYSPIKFIDTIGAGDYLAAEIINLILDKNDISEVLININMYNVHSKVVKRLVERNKLYE